MLKFPTLSLCSKPVCQMIGVAFDATLAPFPPVVRVEATNACNARCTICPHQRMKRSVARMDDELYTQIVDECAENSCRELHLHNFGEPLLDRKLEERVAYAKQCGIAKVKIFTNGSLLSQRRIRGLIEAGLDEIKVSFDGATKEEFEKIRHPLKFDLVVNNIHQLVAERDQAGSKMQIHVACCTTSDKTATMQAIESKVDAFSFGKIHNWADDGDTAASTEGGIRKPCSRLWQTFTILVSGEVSLCCLDYEGRHVLGRVGPESSIADVWTGEPYRRIRQQHRAGRQAEIALCSTCTKSFLAAPARRAA